MSAFSCCTSAFASLSRAAAKSAASRLRRLGLLSESIDWARRAALCERCHLRVVQKGTSYCGLPFLENVKRDPAHEGCGCPTRAKAKSPDEHCPLDWNHRPARQLPDGCTCKWCNDYE
jgi:hypothetical protein